jgi:hypothetical protein
MVTFSDVITLSLDLQIHKLIRQIPEVPDLLRTILRNATGEDPPRETEESTGDESYEEGNEVIGLTRTALSTLQKLPPLEELEQTTHRKGTAVEEEVPSGVQQKE